MFGSDIGKNFFGRSPSRLAVLHQSDPPANFALLFGA